MLRAKISPSLMCADIFGLRGIINDFEHCGIEYLHIDVMDGQFVPNFCLGTDYCRRLKAGTAIPLDIHLMVTEPAKKLGVFPFGEGDIVSVHHESGGREDTVAALKEISGRGAIPFIALNPDTPAETALGYAGLIGGVLLMTVYPGFAGQKMVEGSLEKITLMRKLLDENCLKDIMIEVDGNVNYEKAPLMRKAGADLFVVGTSSILGPGDIKQNTEKMRTLLEEADR
jgi:ribulose-phosphate 3-epimerase